MLSGREPRDTASALPAGGLRGGELPTHTTSPIASLNARVDGGSLASDPRTSAALPSMRLAAVCITIFCVMALLELVDIIGDGGVGLDPDRLVTEALVLASSVVVMAVLAGSLTRTRGHARTLSEEVAGWQGEAERWRGETTHLVGGLGAAIDRQFDRWSLTQAERAVALLLIKGLSVKEIADLRASSARTVSQQTRAIYRKAGLGGRSELAAFFLQDLLSPRG